MAPAGVVTRAWSSCEAPTGRIPGITTIGSFPSSTRIIAASTPEATAHDVGPGRREELQADLHARHRVPHAVDEALRLLGRRHVQGEDQPLAGLNRHPRALTSEQTPW